MEDGEIVRLYWERSEQAIPETETKYGGYCSAIARNILDSREDAEECVNDTWLKAWNAMPPHRPAVLSTFLGKITRNLSFNRWKRNHADKRGGGLCAVLAARTFGGSSRLISKYDCNRSASYPYPKPGTYFCFVDVNEARRHYAGRDVEFLLAFELFKGEDGNERVSQEELQAEYQRLAGLGFRFYEVEAWTYRDMGVREYYTVVMGAFTEEQLAGFPASPDYGYAFHFVHNGNGSGVRVNESDLITDFESHLI